MCPWTLFIFFKCRCCRMCLCLFEALMASLAAEGRLGSVERLLAEARTKERAFVAQLGSREMLQLTV